MIYTAEVKHIQVFLSRILKAGIGCYYDWIIPRFAWEVKNLQKISGKLMMKRAGYAAPARSASSISLTFAQYGIPADAQLWQGRKQIIASPSDAARGL